MEDDTAFAAGRQEQYDMEAPKLENIWGKDSSSPRSGNEERLTPTGPAGLAKRKSAEPDDDIESTVSHARNELKRTHIKSRKPTIGFAQLAGGVLPSKVSHVKKTPPRAPSDGNVSHLISSDSEEDVVIESKQNSILDKIVQIPKSSYPPIAPLDGNVSHLISSDSESSDESILNSTTNNIKNIVLSTDESAEEEARRQNSDLMSAGFEPLPVDGDVSLLMSSESDSELSLTDKEGQTSKAYDINNQKGELSENNKNVTKMNEADSIEGKWEEFMDEGTGFPYYIHSITAESCWKHELDEKGVLPANIVKYNPETEGGKIHIKMNEWDKHIDPELDEAYYSNRVTGESLWESEVKIIDHVKNTHVPTNSEVEKINNNKPTADHDLFVPDDEATPVELQNDCSDTADTTPFEWNQEQGSEEGKFAINHDAFDGQSPLWASVQMSHRRDETISALSVSQQRITLVAVCASIGAVLLVNKKHRRKEHLVSPRVFCLEDSIGDVVRALVAWGAAGPNKPSINSETNLNEEINSKTIPHQSQEKIEIQGQGTIIETCTSKVPVIKKNKIGAELSKRKNIAKAKASDDVWRLFYPGGSCILPFPQNPGAWHNTTMLETHCKSLKTTLAEVMASSPVAARLSVTDLLVGVREVPFVCAQQSQWIR